MNIIRNLRWEIAEQLAKRSLDELQRGYKNVAEFEKRADRSRKLLMISFKFIPSDQRTALLTEQKDKLDEAINECRLYMK